MQEDTEYVEQIRRLRESIKDPNKGYLARTRLRRLILSGLAKITKEVGLPKPTLPGPFIAPQSASAKIIECVELSNRLYQRATRLCQPSEPLDTRWRNQWSELDADLERLERIAITNVV
jgi:hypothetical protein